MEIVVSQRELIEAGILPEEYKWRQSRKLNLEPKKGKVSPADIARTEMGLEKGLTTTEIGGVKRFIKEILDRFKGKGEK